jgi:ribosomal protein S6--L-glutamate ligase
MRLGIISLGGKSSLALARVCREYFDRVDNLDIRDFDIGLTNNGTAISFKGKELEDYDCLVLRGSFRYALLQRAITRAYYDKIYMPAEPRAFTLAHDKFLTLVELQKNDVSIPKTHYAASTELAKEILEKVSYPIIMKLQEGTHGKGVMVAESKKSAKTILDMLDTFNKPYIIQEFVKTEEMSDIRAIVAGNEILASYKRVAAEGEVRANIHSGGTREAHVLTKEEKRLAIKAAKAIGAEICGVDIFDSKKPSIIEINLSPSLHSIHEVSGKEVLPELAKYIFMQTVRFKKKREEKIMKKIKKREKKKSNKEGGNGAENVLEQEKKPEHPKTPKKIPKSSTPRKKSSSGQLSLDEVA